MPDAGGLSEWIGGRWAVSLRAWVITAAIVGVQALLITVGEENDPRARQVVAVTGLLAVGASGLVLLVADRTVLRHRRERIVSGGTVVAIYIAAGIAAAAVISVGFNYAASLPRFATVNFTAETPILTGLLIAPVVAGSLLGCALIFDAYDRLRGRQALLLTRLETLEQDEELRSDLASALAASAEREVYDATDSVLDELALADDTMTARERLALAARLERSLEETVRPLADRLAALPQATTPDRWSLIRVTLERSPIRPGLVTIGLVTIMFLFLFNRRGFEYAAIQSGFQIPVTYLPLVLVEHLHRRGRIPAGWTLPLGIAVAAIGLVLKAATLQWILLGEIIQSNIALGVFWVVAIVILTSVVSAAFGARRDDIRALEETLDERLVAATRANREVARTSRELAQYVHGTLQSTLLATAFAMERANAANDPTAFAEAAAAARHALTESEPVRRQATSLAEAVEYHRRLWGEFTEITCVIDVDGDPGPQALRTIDLIVEEGIANAKKHGRSERVTLTVDRVPEGIRVRIADDGTGPGGGAAGYGSTLLDRAAPNAWTLTAGASAGAVLTAVVPDP